MDDLCRWSGPLSSFPTFGCLIRVLAAPLSEDSAAGLVRTFWQGSASVRSSPATRSSAAVSGGCLDLAGGGREELPADGQPDHGMRLLAELRHWCSAVRRAIPVVFGRPCASAQADTRQGAGPGPTLSTASAAEVADRAEEHIEADPGEHGYR